MLLDMIKKGRKKIWTYEHIRRIVNLPESLEELGCPGTLASSRINLPNLTKLFCRFSVFEKLTVSNLRSLTLLNYHKDHDGGLVDLSELEVLTDLCILHCGDIDCLKLPKHVERIVIRASRIALVYGTTLHLKSIIVKQNGSISMVDCLKYSDNLVDHMIPLIKLISRVKKWYKKKKQAMIIIERNLFNWVWKPVCNDGTLGVRPRLDIRQLGLES